MRCRHLSLFSFRKRAPAFFLFRRRVGPKAPPYFLEGPGPFGQAARSFFGGHKAPFPPPPPGRSRLEGRRMKAPARCKGWIGDGWEGGPLVRNMPPKGRGAFCLFGGAPWGAIPRVSKRRGRRRLWGKACFQTENGAFCYGEFGCGAPFPSHFGPRQRPLCRRFIFFRQLLDGRPSAPKPIPPSGFFEKRGGWGKQSGPA